MTASESSPPVALHAFADRLALAEALAAAVAADLRAALLERDFASVALSGGTTPRAFLEALAVQPLDWSRVVVTLVDERWVPESSPRSNAALLKAHLLDEAATLARFVPLYRHAARPEDALPEIERALQGVPLPFDALVLGMGEDGHTASFFAGGDRLADALDPAGTQLVLPMRATGAGEPRLTLTLPPILAARHLYLHIEGAAKQEVLRQALSGEGAGLAYPVRSVLARAGSPLRVYWTA
ncbi:MAG: 6-phosphogluconolactonase [Pseudoxanthomonas sp.]